MDQSAHRAPAGSISLARAGQTQAQAALPLTAPAPGAPPTVAPTAAPTAVPASTRCRRRRGRLRRGRQGRTRRRRRQRRWWRTRAGEEEVSLIGDFGQCSKVFEFYGYHRRREGGLAGGAEVLRLAQSCWMQQLATAQRQGYAELGRLHQVRTNLSWKEARTIGATLQLCLRA